MFMPRECKDNVTALRAFILKLRFHRLATFEQALAYQFFRDILLPSERNSIRLSGPAHGNHSQREVPLLLEDILFSECPRDIIVVLIARRQKAILIE